MTYYEVTKAYPALKVFAECSLPAGKAVTVYRMMKRAFECYEFTVREERKLMEIYGGKSSGLQITFNDEDSYRQFTEKLEEVKQLEAVWDFEEITVTEEDLGSQKVSPRDMLDLEGFIRFE